MVLILCIFFQNLFLILTKTVIKKTKDISVEKQTDKELKEQGYDYTNGQNDYRINFSSDSEKGLNVQFDECSYSIIPESSIPVSGSKETATFLNEEFEVFEYENIYGSGTTLRFYPQLNGVKEEIVLDSNIGQNSFSFFIKTDNCTAVLNDDGTVSLISSNDDTKVQTFSAPFAYDSEYVEGDYDEHYIDCDYELTDNSNGEYVLTVTVDKNWLDSDNTVYPVIIDPTTSNLTLSADASIYQNKGTNNYGNEQTCCFGYTTEYGIGRAYTKFTVPSAIKKGAVINSAYQWLRETTGRTNTTYVKPFMVTSSWSETGIYWSNRPSHNLSVVGTRRNINSTSTDDSRNHYWYKFDLKNAVKKWVDGSPNYGVTYISEEEQRKAYEWRAFASRTYSSSAMRPYTVINYTNDSTAPTVTSVTGNATSWTKNNVTLTVNGAADNSGGSGLHSTPYSFSTTKGNYSWQSAKTKTFSSNCTVYVYVRDAIGNIRLVSTQTINKIDKTAPTTPTVIGNPTDWTNASVTLTASSSDSASGVSQYSFSTTLGVYSWQDENTKTFSENTTVYVYAKDSVGNISQPQTVVIDKIDKNAPSAPILTGEYDEWSNGDVEITAESTDDLSGINSYSFSTKPDEYKWQTECTAVISESSKVYVCSKDNAGNISPATEIDLKIDRLSPTGSVQTEHPTDWVREIKISADASDELSGLHSLPYSFSTVENEYIWQESNEYTVTKNGTVFVYARDSAENIVLLDTIVVDKIDHTSPTIKDVQLEDIDNKTKITIIAEDMQSGINKYSIDNGKTWQTDNTFEIEKDSLNRIFIKVSDNLGNVALKRYDIYRPQMYYENGKLCLYNPNPKCESEIYYKFIALDVKWIKYDKPITVPENKKSIYVTFFNTPILQTETKVSIDIESLNYFSYSEKNTDLSLTYNGVSFNIDRQYKNDVWNYSVESSLTVENGGLIKATMPDFTSYMFTRKNKYLYVDQVYGYELNVVYDDSDEYIVEYIVNIDGINYHYHTDGVLSKISNKSGNLFDFAYTDNCTVIKDAAGRATTLKYVNNRLTSITDANGGVINYYYDDNNLIKVTDQANVVIGEYKYDNDILIKSGFNNIQIDDKNRVSQIVADNGYYKKYEYNENEVTITTADEKLNSFTYDSFGKLLSTKDDKGEVTTYTYDSLDRLVKVSKGEEVLKEYTYDESERLIYQSDESGEINYYYNDDGYLEMCKKVYDSPSKSNEVTHYVYDENGNVVIEAKVSDTDSQYPDKYTPEFEYDEVVKYEYQNGIVTKKITEKESVTVTCNYYYDVYGNISKTTTSTEKENQTSISVSENNYDVLNRLVSSKNDESQIDYTYDAAGRTLLVNTDGSYQRTVYDDYGRVVQEIDNSDYNPDLDNLPKPYSNTDVGQRYVYDNTGSLVEEINSYDIKTTYEYSDVGTVSKKHFDIYDYYYLPNGNCDKIDVNGETIEDYDYNVTDSEQTVGKGKYINRVKYANGCIEEDEVDENGNVYRRYVDGDTYFYIHSSSTENSLVYGENESYRRNTVIFKDNIYDFIGKTFLNGNLFRYTVKTEDDVQTVSEEHFGGKKYTTVISENSVSYTTPTSEFSYTVDSNDDTATVSIVNGETELLSSEINYNEDENVLTKSYGEDNVSFEIHYDDNGNIASDENNQYQYDGLGQLKATTGNINSSYTYDDRGNMLSKTVNGVTTSFAYTSDKWQDQLTSVNGNALSYDANGNLLSYDGKTYTWSHRNWLAGITDGDNTISYNYDSNGIRSDKTVNGVKTSYNTLNGKILAQYDDTNEIYFQYSNDAPIGFVLNDIQYFYITNPNGDIVGITDSNGELIAEYSYDEWGKLLGIRTAQEDNAEQLTVAEINPFRYRGYYYDNETGMYYLQSRYYDPYLCRFISADDFAYINTDTPMSVNAYVYCINNPLKYSDYTGTEAGFAIGSLIFYSFALLTGLFFIYIILEIIIATMNGTAPTITFPSISFSTSVPTAAERADSKVKDTIKSAKYTQYWQATRMGTYIVIGKELNFRDALTIVILGGDVFAASRSAAYTLATTASGGKTPVGPEWDRDKEDVIGYYAHYHTANRNGAHIFYI